MAASKIAITYVRPALEIRLWLRVNRFLNQSIQAAQMVGNAKVVFQTLVVTQELNQIGSACSLLHRLGSCCRSLANKIFYSKATTAVSIFHKCNGTFSKKMTHFTEIGFVVISSCCRRWNLRNATTTLKKRSMRQESVSLWLNCTWLYITVTVNVLPWELNRTYCCLLMPNVKTDFSIRSRIKVVALNKTKNLGVDVDEKM